MADMNLAPNTSEIVQLSVLKIKYDYGLCKNGRTIVKTKSFSNFNPEAKSIDIYNVGEILNTLQKRDVLSVVRIDNTKLTLAN